MLLGNINAESLKSINSSKNKNLFDKKRKKNYVFDAKLFL